ncbi:MAG: hypothetical protein GEU75_10335 [Dehalococcoidia bacterium]|nr:hypothetical protein [Dehalococcoidia bacterium]
MTGRLQDFFGDDWEEALDSLKSAPGAFGNILVGTARQVRPFDVICFGLVVAGWLWLIVGYGIAEDRRAGLLILALLPTALWLLAGIISGLIFEIGGFGIRALGYWEAYLLILLCGLFGVVTLRLALNPKDRRVYHGSAPAADA